MDNYMKLCTEETTQDELRTIIQTVNLQEQGKVNFFLVFADQRSNYPKCRRIKNPKEQQINIGS